MDNLGAKSKIGCWEGGNHLSGAQAPAQDECISCLTRRERISVRQKNGMKNILLCFQAELKPSLCGEGVWFVQLLEDILDVNSF